MAVVPMPRIEQTEVDGVPVIWSESPGLLTATLQFRVGRVDERPAEAGVTHIVEHLTMVPLGQPRYEHNAFVEPNRTLFFLTGTATDVTGYFGTIGATLGGLPTDRLAMERDILARESDGRGTSVADAHRHFRFGLSAHGLPSQPEFGLRSVTEERVHAWAATAFGRHNAGVWMTGPPPADLRFPLVDGRHLPPPPVEPLTDIRWPAHLGSDAPGVGVGFLLSRELGAGTFISILQRRLRQRLRLDRGLVYDVLADYEPLDAASSLGIVGAECAREQNQQVVDLVLAELDALERGEATDDELAAEVSDLERNLGDVTAIAGLLDIMVRDRLLGMPERSPQERYEEQRSTTAAHVAAAAREAKASALLLADITEHPMVFAPYPVTSEDAVAGREVKPLLSVLGFGPKHRLLIGPDGVSVRAKDGTIATVRYADCLLLEVPAEDELVMWGRDGSRVYVPGAFWRGGEGILAEIEAALPDDIVVRDRISTDFFD